VSAAVAAAVTGTAVVHVNYFFRANRPNCFLAALAHHGHKMLLAARRSESSPTMRQ